MLSSRYLLCTKKGNLKIIHTRSSIRLPTFPNDSPSERCPMAAISSNPGGGFIDPTKQAEYPIVLGDRLAAKDSAEQTRLYNIQYNYKTKSATPQQRSIIKRSSRFRDAYDLTITDKTPNADQNTLTYTYEGSVDPDQPESKERNLVLVFDASRKVFVLEPVTAQLNFNLRSAPAKTTKQVLEQYVQLKTLLNDDHPVGDGQTQRDGTSENDGPADEDNPYDYRHFLPKANMKNDGSASDVSTPGAEHKTGKATTPVVSGAAKPATDSSTRSKPGRKPQGKQQAKPARQNKRGANPPVTKPNPPDTKSDPKEAPAREKSEPLLSDAASGLSPQRAASSPGSNIIVDGDLIIDMGSPPPSRPAFKVNPAHFSSSNTPSNLADDYGKEDEDMEYLQLPSPVGRGAAPTQTAKGRTEPSDGNEGEDDDALAAEMEAAFEESAREEEEAKSHQYQQQHNSAPSDDESEVSEEE